MVMAVLDRIKVGSENLFVVTNGNQMALHYGDVGYSCIYTDESIYQPILLFPQQLLERASELHPLQRVLILGGGCCTFPRFVIKRFGNSVLIDSIEYSKEILYLAKKHFLQDLDTTNLHLIHSDAFEYIKTHKGIKYDFILIDLFVGSYLHRKIFSTEFIDSLKKYSQENTIAVFNTYNSSIEERNRLCHLGRHFYDKTFTYIDEDGIPFIVFAPQELTLDNNDNENIL